jgi:hypothetical protein
VNSKLKSTYDDATARDPGSDGYTPEDIAALRNATNYQLNAVLRMRDILVNTAADMAEKVATKLAELLSKEVIKGIGATVVKALVTKLVDQGPIGAFVSNAVNVARSAIPSTTRQQVYGQSLALLLKLFVRQLGDKNTRDRLKRLAGLDGNGKPLEKRLVEGLVGTVVDPVFQALDQQFKAYVYGKIQDLFGELRAAGVAVEAGGVPGVVIAGDTVTIPRAAMLRIESGDAAADAERAAQVWEFREMWSPLISALGAKLTLVSRAEFAAAQSAYAENDDIPAITAAYSDDILGECRAFRARYLAAAGDLIDLLDSDGVQFQRMDYSMTGGVLTLRNSVFMLKSQVWQTLY